MSLNKYIVVKGTAGLGNRMLCALDGILYARLTARTLVIDWTDPMFSDTGSNVFKVFFDNPGVAAEVPLSTAYSVEPAVWRGNLKRTAMELVNLHYPRLLGKYASAMRTSIDVSRTDYPHDIVVLWGWDSQIAKMRRHFGGPFESLRSSNEWDIVKRLAAENFIPCSIIRDRINRFTASHWNGHMIGVHIRNTDRKTPIYKFHRAVRRALRTHSGSRIFLATDSREINDSFLREYRNVVVMEKEFTADGGAIHMDLGHSHRTARAIDALTEMFLLSECSQLIYAGRSTFSVMAHALSQLPEDQVVDIDRHNFVLHTKRFVQRNLRLPVFKRAKGFVAFASSDR